MTGKLCCRNERAEEQSVFRRCPSLLSLTLMSVLLSPLSLQAADKGSEKGNGTTHTETTVDAGNRLTIISGRDTTLTGAQAGGETVKVDAGRHLTLTSEQDSDRYDSKQQNASAGGSFTFGSMSGSASVNLSRDKMHSNYDSVQEQTGIFAGRGGFDVTTGQHTQLNGAVIASTATADKNRLDTGTLGFSDIENRADYKVEHQSVGISTGGSIGGQFAGNMANNLLVGANHEGHADSTTQSAVSAGNITIRDTKSQKQDVADLNRDAAHANQTLSPIFDREKEHQRLQQAQLIGEIGNQVADIARTEGQIAGEKAKRDPAALNQARAELEAAGKPFTEQDVAQRAYNNGMAASGFGTGGKYQQAIQAATAAVQGLAGGNLSAALAGGAAPYIAEIIKQTTPDGAGRVAAHAVVNAALSLAKEMKSVVDNTSKYPDWSKCDNIKAKLKVELILLLHKHKSPPVANDDVYMGVLAQAENLKKNHMS